MAKAEEFWLFRSAWPLLPIPPELAYKDDPFPMGVHRTIERLARRCVLLTALAASIFSCQMTDPQGQVVRLTTRPPESDTFGTVDGQQVRLEDLDNATRRRIYRARRDVFLAQKSAFERESAQFVLEKAAHERGMTVDQLLEHDVDEPQRNQAESQARDFVEKNAADLAAAAATELNDASALRAKAPDAVRKIVFESLKKHALERARRDYIETLLAKSDVKFMVSEPEPLRQALRVQQNPSLGPESAPLEIVEFGAYGDGVTAKMEERLHAFLREKPGKIVWYFVEAPRKDASEFLKHVHRMSACAQHLGSFWGFHDALVAHYGNLADKSLPSYLKEAGILEAQMRLCMNQAFATEVLARDRALAQEVALEESPVFFVNGIEVRGADGPRELERVVANEEKSNQFLAVEKAPKKAKE